MLKYFYAYNPPTNYAARKLFNRKMKAVEIPDYFMNTYMKSPVEEWANKLDTADLPKIGRSMAAFIVVLLNLIIPNKLVIGMAYKKLTNITLDLPDFPQ